MVSGALLHALRIGMDSAYNNDEIDQAGDHHNNADARADAYAFAYTYILKDGLDEMKTAPEFSEPFFSRIDYKFT